MCEQEFRGAGALSFVGGSVRWNFTDTWLLVANVVRLISALIATFAFLLIVKCIVKQYDSLLIV
jgi:hypothetical protein